jgi:hypothetical protein
MQGGDAMNGRRVDIGSPGQEQLYEFRLTLGHRKV